MQIEHLHPQNRGGCHRNPCESFPKFLGINFTSQLAEIAAAHLLYLSKVCQSKYLPPRDSKKENSFPPGRQSETKHEPVRFSCHQIGWGFPIPTAIKFP